MEMTPEGYLICKNVPICRSGYQEYFGRELEGFPGFTDSWGLDPNLKYKVLRPKEEVVHPDTLTSLEGKTVTDTHPNTEGNVLIVDNDEEFNCGHIQNVTQGPDTPDGNVTLQGNLVIKNPELIEKVRPTGDPENGIRDVSCGYILRLKRLADGSISMYRIRGNHVAVVPTGRAGDRIAIQDAAPPEIKTQKRSTMSLRDLILGRGVKSAIADASDEDLALIGHTLLATDSKGEEKDDKDKGKVTVTAAAVDAAHDATTCPACDEANKTHHKGAHDALDAMLHASNDADRSMHRKALGDMIGEDSTSAADEGKETLEELKAKEEKKGAKDDGAADEDEGAMDGTEPERIDNKGASVLKAANDSILGHVKAIRPLVASFLTISREKRTVDQQAAIDSYNGMVKSLNNSGGNVYKVLTTSRIPDGIGAVDSRPNEMKSCTCFDGVSYRKGMERHQQNCVAKEGK